MLHTPTNTPYALKCMRKGQIVALKQVEHVMNEKTLLDACDHPFLLRLAATFQDSEEIYMLLELALGGELFTVLRNANKFEEPQGRFYAACVCSAFSYMHDLSIVYRDLKPENLLFDAEGYMKVVDFGFTKKITDRTWTLCGTPEYLAPEIITNKGHNLAVDWWAFGILIFEMLVGQPPFCADECVPATPRAARCVALSTRLLTIRVPCALVRTALWTPIRRSCATRSITRPPSRRTARS